MNGFCFFFTHYPQQRAVKGLQLNENLGGDVYLQW